MSGRWFRLHAELLDDPKVQKLRPHLFKALINLWCIASKNGGVINDDPKELAIALRMRPHQAKEILFALYSLRFFDKIETGMKPHGWDNRQYLSDNSTERTRAYRKKERSRNVSVTPPDTDTDTYTETDKRWGADAPAARGPYAYSGKVVRLNPEDHARWKASFSFLDLNSELEARDNWLAEQPAELQRRWFGSTSKYLANRNMEAKAKAQAPPKPNPTADGFNRAFARIRAHAEAISDQETTNVVDLSEVRRGGDGFSGPPCDTEPSNGCG
jgi:hypothetical protein